MTRKPKLLPTDPFRAYGAPEALGYEAWYHSPAGRLVAAEEQGALATVLATLPAPHSVLEVGCGTGYFTRWLASQSDRVVGVDPSRGMLAVAHAAGSASGYALAAAEALPFADASIDIVAFITALEFFPEPVLALREAARVARAGMLLGVLNQASPLGLRRKMGSWIRPSVYQSARFYTVWSLQRAVRSVLRERLRDLHWTTAMWPRGTPHPIRRLPCGAFIAMAAQLEHPGSGE